MSPRESGRDADGRPIVAELGRAETPAETADRKAAASATRRSNQTAFNLVIALVVSLLVGGAFVFSWVARPSESQRPPVDYAGIAAEAQRAADVPLAIPELPAGWSVNRAEYTSPADGGFATWRVDLLADSEQYIRLVQGVDADGTWAVLQTQQGEPAGSRTLGGLDWQAYDRRDVDDPGNVAYSLVTTVARSTIVLSGTADDQVFVQLAELVAASLPTEEGAP